MEQVRNIEIERQEQIQRTMEIDNRHVRFEGENLITPAPIARIEEELSPANDEYPGEVFVDDHGKLLKRYLDFRGFTRPLIEAYNNWITNIMGSQIATYPIKLNSGEIITFTGYSVDRPMFSSTTYGPQIDYPALAIDSGRTYSSWVYVNIQSTSGEKAENIPVFKVPIMIGSLKDNLVGKSQLELLGLHHDPKDPNGWFVINGTEKIVLLIEKLRANRPLLYYDSIELAAVVKYTCTTVKGSRVITLSADKNNKTRTPHVRLNLQFLGKGKGKNFPALAAYRLLGVNDTSEMLRMILNFVKPEYQRKVWIALQPTVIEVNSINAVNFISKLMGTQELKQELKTLDVTNSVLDDLFPQIPNTNPMGKLQMLSILIARLAENMAGVREFDDRDSWSNKRIDSAAKSIEQLFMGLWTKTIEKVQEDAKRGLKFGEIVTLLGSNEITDGFVSSFSSNNWGVKDKYNKENITDILKRDNMIATYSHLLRITITGSNAKKKKTKSPHIREVQQSGVGIICPAETPEGEACGITKNLAVTAYISIDRDDAVIFEQIKPYLSEVNNPDNTAKLMFNGIFQGWCAGETLKSYLIDLRRQGRLPFDTLIKLDKDGYMYVYTDGARPCRPLLIVDKDGELVIRKKNLWNAPFEVLLSEGAVEYLDPYEQEDSYIAQSIWDMDARKADKLRIVQFYEEAQLAVNTLKLDTDVGNYVIQTDKEGITKLIRSRAQALATLEEAQEVLLTMQKKSNYTHCELDPQAIMGLSASIMPMPERSPAPRVTYQAGMQKQALSIYHSNYTSRFDTTAKVLAFPTRPLFETQLGGYLELKAGKTVIMAIMTFEGFNQEDAIIFNKASLDRGLFTIIKFSKYSAVEKKTSDIYEEFARPKIPAGQSESKFAALDDNGFPRIGAYVREGDYVIGRVRRNIRTGEITNASIPLSIGEEGVIDNVLVTYNPQSERVIRVRIRDVRSPEKGDKFASRYAQKGVIGRIVPPEDMPYNPYTGMMPDIIVNPHCVTADTPVTLANGISRRIADMNNQGCELVWSLDGNKLVKNHSLGLESRGLKDIIEVYLQDGRSIKCTPDHKFYVLRNEQIIKVEAANIDMNNDRVIMGFEAPLDIVGDEDEIGWKLETTDYVFDMVNREKSLAFARLLGYILSDGSVSQDKRCENSINCPIYLGHQLDVESVLNDIYLITGKLPKTRYNESVYTINVPAELGRSISKLEGVTIGRRTMQEAKLPRFLFDNCPKSIIREFLAGLFGGDGHMPIINKNGLTGIVFSQSIHQDYVKSLEEKMISINYLFGKLGIESKIVRMRTYNDVFKSCEISINNVLMFGEKVGFRHCIEKNIRLNAALSYCRLRENVKKQNNRLYELIDQVLETEQIPNSRAGRKDMSLVLDRARELLMKETPILNQYYSLSNMTAFHNRRKSTRSKDLKNFDYDYFPSPKQYFEEIGALDWFNIYGSSKRHYVLNHGNNNVPYFTMKVIDRRSKGQEEVFDIGVSQVHNFIANGIVISNCIPSRMTIGKLIEIIASKHAGFKGERVDATAFRPFDLNTFQRTLRDYGYNTQGFETLYSGTTGDQIKAQIYMGPCYYQALRHHVKDKIQKRDRGAIRPLTHTPVGGRSVGGGSAQKMGEMEQASLVSHGAAALVPERLCRSSDAYTTVWCQTCGTIALHNVISKDFVCRKCEGKGNFGKVTIPYTFKVLTQYLSGIGFKISAKLAKEGEVVQEPVEVGEIGVEKEEEQAIEDEQLSEDEGAGFADYSDDED